MNDKKNARTGEGAGEIQNPEGEPDMNILLSDTDALEEVEARIRRRDGSATALDWARAVMRGSEERS